MSESINKNFGAGDLIEVVKKDGKKFECIVVDNKDGVFVGRVLKSEGKVGTSSWRRYSLNHTCRVQVMSECKSIRLLSKSEAVSAKGSLTLNESVQNSEMTYYRTNLGDGNIVTLCICEGHGGWSFSHNEQEALKESFISSQLSSIADKIDLNENLY